MTILELKRLTGQTHLRGRTAGRTHFVRLCLELADAIPGDTVFVDFRGIKVANGSWLNAAIGELFRWCGQERNDLYPVLVRFPTEDTDELEIAAAVNNQPYPLANESRMPLDSVRLIGPLDEALRRSLLAVTGCEATGADLGNQMSGEKIGATAWNNRLRHLNQMRLARRRSEGRRQYYTAIAGEVTFDGR